MTERLEFRRYTASSGMMTTVLATTSFAFGAGALQIASDDHMSGTVKTWLVLAMGAALGLVIAWIARSATITERGHLVVRGLFRSRRFAWADVQGIEAELNPGAAAQRNAPTFGVVMYDPRGRKITLPHVNEKNVVSLQYEVESLRRMWERLRGEAWTPTPEAAAKLAEIRRYGQPSWMVGFGASMLAIPAALVLFLVLLFSGATDDTEGALELILSPLMIFYLPAVVFVVATTISVLRRRQ